MKLPNPLAAACVAGLILIGANAAAEPIQVVTTLSAYASIAQEVGGDRVVAESISRGDEDAHFVKPKPSLALMLKGADLFVTTGLDLELWAPTLVDKSGNRGIRDGQPGFVSASQGVTLLDVPAAADRSAGDVHVYGNPHIFTSPLNGKIIAANIANGLKRVDPQGAAVYDANLEAFQRRIDERLFGARLVEILGGETLSTLAGQGRLVEFLESQQLEGRPLIESLGGWMRRLLPYRGRSLVPYHKNWIYFTSLFGLREADYVEPKPGIPPSARHVMELVQRIQDSKIPGVLAANYFSARQVEAIAERAGCKTTRVPLGPGGDGPAGYLALVDLWVESVAGLFSD